MVGEAREGRSVAELRHDLDPVAVGQEAIRLVADLFPLHRSMTGQGVRDTLDVLGRVVPLDVREVPSGTPLYDWTVPPEWSVREAYLVAPDGRRVADVAESTLHLVAYSVPLRRRMSLAELRPHLHSLPDQPDLVPYRTAYWREEWGFCLRHDVLAQLPEGEYEVVVDTALAPGSVTYGEAVVPGTGTRQLLLWAHACHPSLANDNCSGLAVAAITGRLLASARLRHTVRIAFGPARLGALAWLRASELDLDRLAGGLVLAGVGDRHPFTYKRSRRGDTQLDRAAGHVLRHLDPATAVQAFRPDGYDERQFCSPGFDLPVGSLGRAPWGTYPQYHTSGDDLDFVSPESLAGAIDAVLGIVDVLERDGCYVATVTRGEAQLSRRSLWEATERPGPTLDQQALLWLLNLSDGRHCLLEVAERAGLAFEQVAHAAEQLERVGLLVPTGP